jgi:hypothetical protein
MQLHEACRTRLIECVEKGLQEAKFKNRNILDYSSFRSLDSCASALPTKIQEQVGGWISDHPIRDFSYGFVGEKRSSYAEKLNSLSKEDFPVGLPEISDVTQMAIQLVDSLLTLPREYTVVLPFVSTAGLNLRLKSLPLSRELTIKKGSDLGLPFPGNPYSAFLPKLFDTDADWSPDRLYLEAALKGYIGSGPNTETLARFYHQVRTVAGIGLAINAFKLNFSSNPTFSYLGLIPALPFKPLYVFQADESGEDKARTLNISDVLSSIDQLELSPNNSDSIILLPIAFGDNEECSTLQEAGQWHFASRTEGNEIFEFVQAVVVLEILFNDKATAAEVGIEKLIANRCAYLLASSTAERQEFISDLKAIYDARSQIVHKGKARLSKAERDLLIKARVLGSSSILKELAMIFRSQQKRAAHSEGST